MTESARDPELDAIRSRRLAELTAKEPGAGTAAEAPEPLTQANFDAFLQRHGLVLVDFWAAWCGPCRAIAPLVDELARDQAGRLAVGKVNVGESPGLAGQCGVTSIPTLILFRNGRPVERIVGAVPRMQLMRAIGPHLR